MRKQNSTFSVLGSAVLIIMALFLGVQSYSQVTSSCHYLFKTSKFGGTIADIYQGKTGEVKVILYQEGESTLTLYSDDGAIVLEEIYSAPGVIHLSLASFILGKYKLVVEQAGESANFDIYL